AIVAEARRLELGLSAVHDFDSVTGQGVRGRVEGRELLLGNRTLMRDAGIEVGALSEQAESLRGEGASVMFLAADGTLLGAIAVADPVKDSTPAALDALRAEGMRIVMATGDSEGTANAVARALRIDEAHGEVTPADKVALVRRLQAGGHVVAMAGDGINDAPALAAADVGIAMGTGTDVAMSSAQVTLVKGDLRRIAEARRISAEQIGRASGRDRRRVAMG